MPSRSFSLRSFALLTVLAASLAVPALAQDMPFARPDDKVQMDLSAENWVTTKTGRVIISVEAAVTSNTAGGMRAAMQKAVGDIAKADWRLTAFNRSQDSAGMERWSALFEARLPEGELTGLNETAKKLSKAGMQFSVANVDFSPTLEEVQATIAQTRVMIYKSAQEQLAALNTALPGRSFRIASIEFASEAPHLMRTMMTNKAMAMDSAGGAPLGAAGGSMERSEKITLTAHVVMATASPFPSK